MSLGEDKGSTLPSSPMTSVKSKSSNVLKEVGSKYSDMFVHKNRNETMRNVQITSTFKISGMFRNSPGTEAH